MIVAQAQVRVLTKFGIAITSADVARRFAGDPDKAMWASLELEYGVTLPPDLPDQYKQALGLAFRDELRPVPEIRQALVSIKLIGLQCCLASGSTPGKLQSMLGQVGVWDSYLPTARQGSGIASLCRHK